MYVDLFMDSVFQSMELCILWTIVFSIIEWKSGLCILDAENMCMPAQLCPTLYNPIDYSQAPLSVGFPRQKQLKGMPFSPPGNLPVPEIEPVSHFKKKKCFPGDTRGKEFACQSISDTLVV